MATDTLEIRELLGEFKTSMDEVRDLRKKAEEQLKATGAVETRLVEMIQKADEKAADQGKRLVEYGERIEKLEADSRIIKQRGLRISGAPGGDGGGDFRTLGERFTQGEQFKAAQFTGKFKFQASVGGRILERKANTITEAGSGLVIYPQRVGVYAPPQLPLVMRDLLNVVPITGTNAIEYVIEAWNYAADYQVAEGDKKAQGDVTYTDATAVVRTIAWFVKISRQMLSDVPYVASTIDSRLIFGVMKKEEHEILFGDGAAGHLKGIMPQATPYAPAGTPSRIDEIAGALATLASQGFPPSAVVMNPMDWSGMLISKAQGSGAYLLGGPLVAEPNRLWGVPIVPTMEMTVGQYLVGAFPGNAALFDRESATVDIAYENEDDFVRNLVTMRAEERVTLAVFVPQAFLKGTFKSATALETEPPAAAHANAKK